MLIPLSEPAKATSDATVVTGALLGWLKVIPWPELAAFAAFVYTALRIVELVIGWLKRK